MSSSTSRATVSTSAISREIKVFDYANGTSTCPPSIRSRRLAAHYLAEGFRVTDRYDWDVTVETRPDSRTGQTTRHLVRGEDVYAKYIDGERKKTLEREEQQDTHATGRPARLAERELTDYEKGSKHDVENCELPNCDDPTHFSLDGKLTFAPPDTKPSDMDKKGGDGDGGAGGAAATT